MRKQNSLLLVIAIAAKKKYTIIQFQFFLLWGITYVVYSRKWVRPIGQYIAQPEG